MSDLTALALDAAVDIPPSELHGVVCGLAVCPEEAFPLQCLIDLIGTDALTDEPRVEAFVAATIDALLAEDLSFTPLLPDDGEALAVRVEALAGWCSGFLAGFGAGVTSDLDNLPEQVQEIVTDIAAISELDFDRYREDAAGAAAAGDAEQGRAESDLMQLQEFVKIGVLLTLSLIDDDSQHRGN